MRILFCTTELQYSNSSAAIRNRILLSGISENAEVDVLELPLNTKLDHDCQYLFKDHFLVKSSFFKVNSLSLTQKKNNGIKDKIKKLIKPFIPDFLYLQEFDIKEVVDFSNYDVVISTSEPKGFHRVISKTVEKYKSRSFLFVQYWGDPWYDDISRPTNLISKFLEYKILSSSDTIIYNSQRTLRRQKSLFKSQSSKMTYLPRGLNLTEDMNLTDCFTVLPDSDVNLLYAGDYRSDYRNISNLVSACSNLGINLHIAGSGDFHKDSNFDSRVIKEKGRLSSSELSLLRREIDIEVVVMNSKGGQLPGKVFDVMLSDKLVILILDGEFTKEDIPCSDRFVIIENDIHDITYCLNTLKNEGYSSTFDKGLYKNYSISYLVNNLINELNENINNRTIS